MSTQIHSRSLVGLKIEDLKATDPVSLKNPIDNVAADGGPGSENGRVAHLLAEFFALFFQLAVFSSVRTDRGARLGHLERNVSVLGRLRLHHRWPLLFVDDVDVTARENAF